MPAVPTACGATLRPGANENLWTAIFHGTSAYTGSPAGVWKVMCQVPLPDQGPVSLTEMDGSRRHCAPGAMWSRHDRRWGEKIRNPGWLETNSVTATTVSVSLCTVIVGSGPDPSTESRFVMLVSTHTRPEAFAEAAN